MSILDRFSAMVTDDRHFIEGARLRVGYGPEPIVPLRQQFDDTFAGLWRRAQDAGQVRHGAHQEDAIDLAGALRDPDRRARALRLVVSGLCTPQVEVDRVFRYARTTTPSWTRTPGV